MTKSEIHRLLLDAQECDDLDTYMAEIGGSLPAAYYPYGAVQLLGDIWLLSREFTFRSIRRMSGLTQKAFSAEYGIPQRTVEDWDTGKREPPAYLLELILSDILTAREEELNEQKLTYHEYNTGEHKMTTRLFLTMPTGYNTDIFGDAYSDMTEEEIDLGIKLYDAIIASLLPDWLRWCGDELYADFDTDNREWAPEVDEDFDINDVLAEACQILWSRDANELTAKYLTEDE